MILYRLADFSERMEHVALYMSNHSECAVSCVHAVKFIISMLLGCWMHAAVGTGE